jgi:hypothetical protein
MTTGSSRRSASPGASGPRGRRIGRARRICSRPSTSHQICCRASPPRRAAPFPPRLQVRRGIERCAGIRHHLLEVVRADDDLLQPGVSAPARKASTPSCVAIGALERPLPFQPSTPGSVPDRPIGRTSFQPGQFDRERMAPGLRVREVGERIEKGVRRDVIGLGVRRAYGRDGGKQTRKSGFAARSRSLQNHAFH